MIRPLARGPGTDCTVRTGHGKARYSTAKCRNHSNSSHRCLTVPNKSFTVLARLDPGGLEASGVLWFRE